MRNILLQVIVTFSLVGITSSNAQTTKRTPDVKPSVYLSFERQGGRKPLFQCKGESQQGIWLRLHNNSSKPIAIAANYIVSEDKTVPLILTNGTQTKGFAESAEIQVCYEAEAIPVTTSRRTYNPKSNVVNLEMGVPVEVKVPKQSPSYCSCKWSAERARDFQVSWVPAGSSVVFSVPREYLAQHLKIYTHFNYEWEIDRNMYVEINEPYHQVFFHDYELPASVVR